MAKPKANPKANPDELEATEVELVKMVKDDKEADVHPDEVENYKLGDWKEA